MTIEPGFLARNAIVFALLINLPLSGSAEELTQSTSPSELLEIAREVIDSAGSCALITLDSNGRPRARTMDPFPPEDDFVVWFGTNRFSRKVEEIRNDPRVTIYYHDPESPGYVTIEGTATLVDDPEEKSQRWREEWSEFYPDREGVYLLIKVVPTRLEVISVSHGIVGDPETWTPPDVDLEH